MTKSDCIYYEILTEIQAEPSPIFDEYGGVVDYEPIPVEVPIGEACHKLCEYDFDCKDCRHYTR